MIMKEFQNQSLIESPVYPDEQIRKNTHMMKLYQFHSRARPFNLHISFFDKGKAHIFKH